MESCSKLCIDTTVPKSAQTVQKMKGGQTTLDESICPIKKVYFESIAYQNREKKVFLLGVNWEVIHVVQT